MKYMYYLYILFSILVGGGRVSNLHVHEEWGGGGQMCIFFIKPNYVYPSKCVSSLSGIVTILRNNQ